MYELLKDVKNDLICGLRNYINCNYRVNTCNLSRLLFSNSGRCYYFLSDAVRVTEELGVWKCIEIVRKYELENLGEALTPLGDACIVANTLTHIIGDKLLQDIYEDTIYFNDKWNEELSNDDLEDMLAMAETWFSKNSNGLHKIWIGL